MFKTVSGYVAEYAASIGRKTQAALASLKNYTDAELSNIASNTAKYIAEMTNIINA